MQVTQAQQKALITRAADAKSQSYSPYSKFRVGAALLTESGEIYQGCNVENASYGGCICAERTAIVKAVSEGHRKFPAIAVATDVADSFTAPCGICRQFIAEFGLDIVVFMSKPDGSAKAMTIAELLPESFGPSDLDRDRQRA